MLIISRSLTIQLISLAFFIFASPTRAAENEIKIPAFTAYLDPNIHGAKVGKNGITQWGGADIVLWGGILQQGDVNAGVAVRLARGETARLKMTFGAQSKEADVHGTGESATIDFGKFTVAANGYQRFALTGVSKSGKNFGDLEDLILSGTGVREAFFNLQPRRNAASVHLNFPLEKGEQVESFYNELTPRTDPVATYYEACGFSRGYFGIQVNSPTERRVIFSVWDAGNEAVKRSNVADENRVKLLAKGDGVVAGDFGNEGTGGHSHLTYSWKTGETQKLLVTAKVEGDATIYTGYYYFNDTQRWGLIASFRAPRDGKLLHGLYSFNEDFDGANGHLRRLCEFGNQWIKTKEGQWRELTTAGFSHDATGGNDRRDFGAGVTKAGRFYLSNGGFIAEPLKKGDMMHRPSGGKAPADVNLP